jgi:hypothetical protein
MNNQTHVGKIVVYYIGVPKRKQNDRKEATSSLARESLLALSGLRDLIGG